MVKSKPSATYASSAALDIDDIPKSFREEPYAMFPEVPEGGLPQQDLDDLVTWTGGTLMVSSRGQWYENEQQRAELYEMSDSGEIPYTHAEIDAMFERGEWGEHTVASRVAETVERTIASNPNFGGTVVRGLSPSSFDARTVSGLKAGDVFTLGSPSSWSPYLGESSRYVDGRSAIYLVVDASRKRNARITRNEVVVSGHESFTVKRVSRKGGRTVYYLE